ncbi:efflux RND transporter periplasmic adaptor subunit [Pseudoteredinibacter isoporae]|uniref:RND family efflux transporter MFP subunit n=1 Tax=Pseudoteredinibacter isoporae TaxID=570281 RepID=A0A7X0MWJ7_9GAMM|nr:efflux RND transporter periplasmic adaptor subunit [Pseudoteredinibacter isoporae]MBB6522255.1 RND family efflux transporter MFP subunit [Pseudoteredinibacter isoporae]NHO87788.1 efflux RND transporter periplasmic adaptor subunit [Pseudoteredinibacter isoporae]NIB23881.1 efflux RND transporter periplasmic adaptor subunit [Pseudoteredinibacter isoporae]
MALSLLVVSLLFIGDEIEPNTASSEAIPSEVMSSASTTLAYRPSVLEVETRPHQKRLCVKGLLVPKHSLNIRARVAGQVLELPEYALEGAMISRGQLLAKIDDREYRRDVLEARSQLMQAQLNHGEDVDKVRIKRDEWKSVATKRPGDRALNIPQTKASNLRLQSAENGLAVAERRFSDTRIDAPYDLLLVKRFIENGQRVEAGTELFEARSVENHIVVELTEQQFSQLAEDWKQQTLGYEDLSGTRRSHAVFRSGGHYLDAKSRKYRVYLEPESQSHASGSYVYINLPAGSFETSLTVPESSLSRDGHIWSVSPDNRLQKHKATILDTLQKRFVIAAPSSNTHFRIIRYPLARLTEGEKVEAATVQGANAG